MKPLIKKIWIILGAGLLAAGCFTPIITSPAESFTFFDPLPVTIPDVPPDALKYTGISVLALAALCLVLALTNRTKFTWAAGIASTAILTGVYFGFHSKMEEMKTQADEQVGNLFGGMFKGITDSLFEAVELGGTGWYLLGAGCLALILSVFIKNSTHSS